MNVCGDNDMGVREAKGARTEWFSDKFWAAIGSSLLLILLLGVYNLVLRTESIPLILFWVFFIPFKLGLFLVASYWN